MKSSKRALFWYGTPQDKINEYNIATVKKHKIKDILYLDTSISEFNSKEKKYINISNNKKLSYLASKYKLNLINIPIDFNKYKNYKIKSYLNVSRNFYFSLYRKEDILKNNKVMEQIHYLANLSKMIESFTTMFLKDKEYEEIYIFNNRFPTGNAVSKSCISLGINFITFDLFANNRLHYSKNNPVLSPENFKKEVKKELSKILNKEILKEGKRYLSNKLNNKFVSYKVFTKNQVKGLIPRKLSENFICIFTSSEDEIKYYGEDLNFPIIDQYSEIVKLLNLLRDESKQLVVRVHPNQSGMILEKKLLSLEKISNNKLIIIPGASKYDSYAFMSKSLANISFGSSTAIESILLKKNSYLIGRSVYDKVININQFLNIKKCYEKIKKDIKEKRQVSDHTILNASKWATYLTGKYTANELKKKNFDSFFSFSRKVNFYNFLFRFDRFMTYPLEFQISQLRKKFFEKF